MDDDNFFAMPPSDAPPAEMGDFTMVGDDAPQSEPAPEMLGDVNEVPSDMGFAGAPEGDDMDEFGAPPPEEETPIVLGGPPAEDEEDVPVAADDEPIPAASMEPSIMQKWNEEWQETLSKRKDEENAAKAGMVEAARVAIEKFQAEKETKRETRMAKNREDEQVKLEAIEADLENDNTWQRVCKMVELSHDGAHEGADVKKMRDMLILLKNDPARAAAVGA